MMAFDWRIGLCCFIIFVTVTAVTKYVSLASILLSAGIVVEILIFHPGRWDLFAMCVLYAFLQFIAIEQILADFYLERKVRLGRK